MNYQKTEWTKKEIRMLHILGGSIGMVFGLIIAWLSDAPSGNNFSWELLITTSCVVGAFIGAINRVPINSCLGTFLFGGLLGASMGAGSGLIMGAVFRFIVWDLWSIQK